MAENPTFEWREDTPVEEVRRMLVEHYGEETGNRLTELEQKRRKETSLVEAVQGEVIENAQMFTVNPVDATSAEGTNMMCHEFLDQNGYHLANSYSALPQVPPFGYSGCWDNRLQAAFLNPTINVGMKEQNEVPVEEKDDGPDCNFTLEPSEKLIYINRLGEEDHAREEIVVNIRIAGNSPDTFIIRTSQIRQIAMIVGNRYAAATINYGVKKVERVIENRFRRKVHAAPVRRIFTDAGWQVIDGARNYVHDGKNPSPIGTFKTGKNLPSYKMQVKDVGQVFFSACALYRNLATIGVMLMFSLLGVLYQIFDAAGFPPRFLLFLNGKTGSMKTTLARILFVQLEGDANRGKLRRIDTDTMNSQDRGIVVSGRDTVTVFDDFSPAKSPSDRVNKIHNLENLIRMAGDGSTKSRSDTGLADRRGEGVQGVIVVTGELTGHGLSSMLRCFFCFMKREEINEEMVSYFQNNPFLYTTFIEHFTWFVGKNWDQMVSYIKEELPRERETAKKLIKERRVIDAACALRLTADFTERFLINYCQCDTARASQLISEIKAGIIQSAVLSEMLCQEESPADQIARAIGQLLLSREFLMIQSRPTQENFAGIDGFEETDYYYFRPERLYAKVRGFLHLGGQEIMLDLGEVAQLLVNEGVAKPSPNGRNKKTNFARIPIGTEKHVRFLKIFKNRVDMAMREEVE